MKTLLSLLISISVSVPWVFSQSDTEPYFEKHKFEFTNPISSSSLFTGSIRENVHLFQIDRDDISIPINLSYSSNGYKVGAAAGDVGLGWAFSGRGEIRVEVRNKPDNVPMNMYYHDSGPYPTPEIGRQEDSNGNLLDSDSEPDFYHLSCPIGSATFFIENSTIHSIDNELNLEIEFKDPTEQWDGFIVRNMQGIECVFDLKEQTEIYNWQSNWYDHDFTSSMEAFVQNSHLDGQEFFELQPFDYTSKWFMTIIKDLETLVEMQYTYNPIVFGQKSSWQSTIRHFSNSSSSTQPFMTSASFEGKNSHQLNFIEYEDGSIQFEYDFLREDLMPLPADNFALSAIKLKDNDDNVVKKFELAYDHFADDEIDLSNWSTNLHHATKKLRLLSVTEFGSNNNPLPPFEFFYTSDFLPHNFSSEVDYWGYYNNNNANTKIPKTFIYSDQDVTFSEHKPSLGSIYKYLGLPVEDISYGADRSSNFAVSSFGILQKIKYPYSGYKKFEFEPHVVKLDGLLNESGGDIVTVGGARIKNVQFTDSQENTLRTINYAYEDNNDVPTGKLLDIPIFSRNVCWSLGNYTTVSSAPLNLPLTFNGSYVAYERVTIEEGAGENGYTELHYELPYRQNLSNPISPPSDYLNTNVVSDQTIPSICHIEDLYPFGQKDPMRWNMGSIISEMVFDSQGALKIEKNYTYEIFDLEFFPIDKIRRKDVHWPTSGWEQWFDGISRQYYSTARKRVSNLLIKEFDDVGNVLENETSYEYNTNNTLKKIIRNSGGSYENTDLFYYANDFLEEISQSQYPALYEDLLQFNDYYSDLPIEFISTRLDSQTGSELVVLGAHHELGESNGATNIKETAVLSFPNGSIDFSTFVLAKDNNGAKDSRYIAKNSLSFNKGKLTGSSISSSVHRTNILSKNEQNVVCSFVHSKPLDSRFENFESLPENPLDGFVLGDNSMTGYKGAEIDVAFGSNDPNDLFTIVIDPESQSGKFQLALWVNTESNYQSNLCKLQLFTSDSTGGINTIYPANTSQIESLKEILIPNTQGVWKMIRTNIDLESIRAAANLPNDDLYLVVKMVNSDLSAKVFVDDLKLSTSNLYSINSAYDRHNRLTSVCYDNENCLNFEYDEFGRLKRERDSDGNLIHEYNYEFDLQGSEGNFIERVLLKQEVADPTNIPNLNGYAKQVTREFSDDLGRKIQVVKAGSSPLKRDQVLYTEYDEFGRMKRSYMPYSHSSDGDGSFKEFASVEQGQFYSNASRVAHTNFPYSEFKFDGSPLNRVEEKGHQGEQWELSSGETTEKKIKFNAADEIVSWLIDASGDLVYNDYYPENALKIVEEIDADNQITLLITDKYGNQILRRKN